ncbi:MAG TPA: NADH-quinone oxidoreductase subunit L, partial [Candidatus Berkiella sp.]|nr:NADH-quinone oxidoreductase subunit L [Candidatus Berkiella sp.]
FYVLKPSLAETVRKLFSPLYTILVNKYGFDAFNQTVIAGGARGIGRLFWHVGDEKLIDGLIVNGSAKTVGFSAKVLRHLQSGYVYHYAFAMITGLLALTLWLMVRG